MAFHEVQFPTNISRNARGGPRRRTQIVALAGGREERNGSWANSRRAYDVAYAIRSADLLAQVTAFFEARLGQLYGFRFKDWADYKSCFPSQSVTSSDQPLGTGDGTTTQFQLAKVYASGGFEWSRDITKPVEDTVVIHKDAPAGPELVLHSTNLQSSGGSDWSNYSALGHNSSETYGSFSLAYEIGTTGAGRREQNTPLAIVGGTTYRVSAWFKELSGTGGNLTIRDPDVVGGTSRINGPFASPAVDTTVLGPITNVVTTNLGGGIWKWSFDWVPNSSYTNARAGAGNFVSGNSVVVFAVSVAEPPTSSEATNFTVDTTTGIVTFTTAPIAGTVLKAGFEFDVPVRFDTDQIDTVLSFERQGTINSIPLIEVRE